MRFCSYYNLVIIAIINIAILASCNNTNEINIREIEATFNTGPNILEEIIANINEETRVIDFSKDSNPRKHLLRGWSLPEKNITWVEGQSALLLFHSFYLKDDKNIKIICTAMPSKENKTQRVDLALNNKSIGSFVVHHGKENTIDFVLPASYLKFGPNILHFGFAYSTKPIHIMPNSKDIRELSVAFKKAFFGNKNGLRVIDNKALVQKAGGSFDFYCELPSTFGLDIDYESVGDSTPYVTLIDESKRKFRIELSQKNTNYKRAFSGADKKIYKIKIGTDGEYPDTHTIWKKVTINTRSQEHIKRHSIQGFSKLTKPHIFLYVIDALRADHLGCYGYSRKTSPNIDAFARENAIYENAYVASSWTRPSGASIITGLLPKNNKTMGRQDKLPNELVTLAEILQKNGYYTSGFVTNGNVCEVFGFGQGFDEFKHLKENVPVTIHTYSDKLNDEIFGFLDSYLARKQQKPLFMFIWSTDPHDPYTPPEEVRNLFDIDRFSPIDTYDLKCLGKIMNREIQPTKSQIEFMKTRYDQEIYFNDMSFGTLIRKIKALGLYDESIMILTSDHGEEFLDHGSVAHGYTLYDEVVRIPFIIKAKGIEKRTHEKRIQLIDIYPTILDILGIGKPYALDGISLSNNSESRRTLYFEERFDGNDLDAILFKDRKLIYTQSYFRPPSKKYVECLEMFDIKDIHEKKNIEFSNFEDELRLQKLFSFMNSESNLGFQEKKAYIPPELDQKLKELGYVK